MSADTVFDRILRGELQAEVVFEDDTVLAFTDINPQAPVHVLVIPKQKIRSFNEIADQAPQEVAAFFIGVSRVARKLGLAENGYRIVLNCGLHGQQSVDYLHAHILGARQMNWPPG